MNALLALVVCIAGTPAATTDSNVPGSPEARRAAVENSLLPREWARGHAFTLDERMRILSVPGVSIAVIHNGKIDWAAGYGVRDVVTREPVTSETMFQAASISKPISAMTTLRLAQEGVIDLDSPINDLLKSYQLPPTEFEGTVTPRRILSHTAGLGGHGFPGYQSDEAIPTAPEVVAGRGNTEAVVQVGPAGRTVRYSGGGSTVLQVALADITGEDFGDLAQRRVLGPLAMNNSTYAQPLSSATWPNHSAGHDMNGGRLPGRVHVYPELFAAGLWTTPSDIARFAIELQTVAASQDGAVLDARWGRTMLTPELQNAAPGLFISEYGGDRWFRHGGANEGFRCDFRASFAGGHGVVVMTNGDAGITLCHDIIRAVASVYNWPDAVGEPLQSVSLTAGEMQRYVGRYEFDSGDVVLVEMGPGGDRLEIQQLPYPRLPLAPLGEHRFQILGSDFQMDFHGVAFDDSQDAASLTMSMNSDQHARRMMPDSYSPVQDLLAGDPSVAIAFYRRAFAANADDRVVDCRRLTGFALGLSQWHREEAGLSLAQLTVELYPDDARAWDALGRISRTLGHRDAAIDAYRTCLDRIPSDLALDDRTRARLRENVTAILEAVTQS